MRDYETFIAAVRDLPVNVIIAAGSPWSQRTFNVSSELPENVQVQSFSATEMRDLYRSASVVVVPVEESPRSSGITVVLEAWAMKRPIVATRTAGLVSYIQDGMNGLLAEPNNPDDMRAKIQSILDNPGQAARLGENGYHTVIKKFYLDDFVSRVQSIVVQKAEQMRFST
jgi:glycosyltransferase involved in cell wall biosynthesis